MSDSYAIIESGGKQYRVEEGAALLVDRLPGRRGGEGHACARSCSAATKHVVIDPKELEKVKVEAKVAEHLRGDEDPGLQVQGRRRATGSCAGHRSELTRLEVTEVRC